MADSFWHKVVAPFRRKYNANWFVNFLKVAQEEDASQNVGVSEPLRSHAWLATAIDFRADNLARAPFRIYSGDNEVTTGPVYKLFRDVNSMMSRRQLFRATESWLAYKGEAFWVFDFLSPEERGLGLPKEIYVIDPRLMSHSVDDNGRVSMWTYEKNEVKIPLLPDEVVHFAYWNPWDLYRGVSRIVALGHEIATDVDSARANLNLIRNGSIPQGILSTEQFLSPEQAQDVVERWEQKHRGSHKAHKIAVLGQGTTYQQIALTPADMEYGELKRWDRQTILARLGVPGVLIGAEDGRTALSGSDTKYQQRNLWETAIIPDLDLIQDKLRSQFFARFKLNLVGEFDLDGIQELHEDTDLLHSRLRADVAGGLMTINEARDALGFDPVPGGDELYTQMSWVPLGSRGGYFGEEEEEETRAVAVTEYDGLFKASKAPIYTEEYKMAHWKAVMADWDTIEAEYQKALKKWMFRQRTVILDQIAKGAKVDATKNIGQDDLDAIMDEAYWRTEAEQLKEFSRTYFRQGAVATEATMRRLFRDIGISLDDSWSIFDTRAVQLIDYRLTKIGGIVDTIRNHVGDAIERGITEGLSQADIAEIIRDQYSFNASRCATIARTEIGNVIEDSRFATYQNVDVEYTIWVSARDDKVRDGHNDADNPDPVKLGERFPNGLRYPNDPEGDAGQVINCRCITIPYVEV